MVVGKHLRIGSSIGSDPALPTSTWHSLRVCFSLNKRDAAHTAACVHVDVVRAHGRPGMPLLLQNLLPSGRICAQHTGVFAVLFDTPLRFSLTPYSMRTRS